MTQVFKIAICVSVTKYFELEKLVKLKISFLKVRSCVHFVKIKILQDFLALQFLQSLANRQALSLAKLSFWLF